jgi:hypothetical protein
LGAERFVLAVRSAMRGSSCAMKKARRCDHRRALQ